jgi:hypothetical protein
MSRASDHSQFRIRVHIVRSFHAVRVFTPHLSASEKSYHSFGRIYAWCSSFASPRAIRGYAQKSQQ